MSQNEIGDWEKVSPSYYFYKNDNIQTMDDIYAYLALHNISPINQQDQNHTDSGDEGGDNNSTFDDDGNETENIFVTLDINQTVIIELNSSVSSNENSIYSILSQPDNGTLNSIELADQEQLENPSGSAATAGQIFTPSVSGHLSKIKSYDLAGSGGYLEVRPYSGDLHANMFDGQLLATSEEVSDLPSTANWTDLSTFNFTEKPYLEAGEKYVFKVRMLFHIRFMVQTPILVGMQMTLQIRATQEKI